jgi:hypothetical protein
MTTRTLNNAPTHVPTPNAVQFQSQGKHVFMSELYADFDEHKADVYQRYPSDLNIVTIHM